jgi:hypothetical protein
MNVFLKTSTKNSLKIINLEAAFTDEQYLSIKLRNKSLYSLIFYSKVLNGSNVKLFIYQF